MHTARIESNWYVFVKKKSHQSDTIFSFDRTSGLTGKRKVTSVIVPDTNWFPWTTLTENVENKKPSRQVRGITVINPMEQFESPSRTGMSVSAGNFFV